MAQNSLAYQILKKDNFQTVRSANLRMLLEQLVSRLNASKLAGGRDKVLFSEDFSEDFKSFSKDTF
jgi:hypothetical protein